MIVIEWESRSGKMRRICLGSKEACGSLTPLGQVNEEANENMSISIRGIQFSNSAAILVDKNFKYGLISKFPSELAFKDFKNQGDLVALSEVIVEFKNTKERLSVSSLLSIIESNVQNNHFKENETMCVCK